MIMIIILRISRLLVKKKTVVSELKVCMHMHYITGTACVLALSIPHILSVQNGLWQHDDKPFNILVYCL